MKTILLISPYWKEEHRWMVSSVKLAELWQRRGYRVVAVTMAKKSGVEKVSETLTVHRVRDFFLPDPFNYGIALTFFFHVFRVLHSEKPDIIVVNKVLYWSTISLLFLRLTGRRVILLTDVLLGMTWWPRPFIAKVCGAIYAWTLGWILLLSASKIVFFHPQPERLLQFLGIRKKSMVIPTGIDETIYKRSAPRPGSGQVVSGQKEVTVMYVGRLESVKGVDDFLAAVVPLKKENPGLEIQVVGWYRKGHPLVHQYGEMVTFTGLQHDIPAILAQTDIFVLPSYSEGLSNALMEAMASRCACIATRVGGNAYLIEDGVSGLLFRPGDREGLRDKLRRLINDPDLRKRLGTAARKRIEDTFSWSIVGGKYATLFADESKS